MKQLVLAIAILISFNSFLQTKKKDKKVDIGVIQNNPPVTPITPVKPVKPTEVVTPTEAVITKEPVKTKKQILE